MNTRKFIPVLSLFSGCGGFDLGFARLGFEILLALDNNPTAVATYNHNRRSKVAEVADLSLVGAPQIIARLEDSHPGAHPRGVIAGPPCQFFSIGNVHFRADDVRRLLPGRFADILKHLNQAFALDFFVFENVRGIRFAKHLNDFMGIKASFEDAGFHLFEGVLDSLNFGVPQKRPRVFIIGLNRYKFRNNDFVFPQQTSDKVADVRSAIGHLPEPRFFERGLKPENIPYHPNHWTLYPRSPKFRDGSLAKNPRRGRSFRVLDWDKPSWTVAYGNQEVHVHPSGKRRLSVYEAMLLQGFPSDYRLLGTLSEQVRQISDAVPPQLGEAIAGSLMPILLGAARTESPF